MEFNPNEAEAAPSDNLYVADLPADTTEDSLRGMFGPGVVQCRVMPSKTPGQGTCVALVRFRSIREATIVRETLNGAIPPGQQRAVTIRFCGKPSQAAGACGNAGSYNKAATAGAANAGRPSPYGGGKGADGGKQAPQPTDNLYIKGLPPGIDNASLQGLFSQYGTVVQCKVLPVLTEGQCPHALVRFSTVEEATNVKKSLTGYALEGVNEPLNVEFAIQKPKTSVAEAWNALKSSDNSACKGCGKGGYDGSWDGGKGGFDGGWDGCKGGKGCWDGWWGGKGYDDGGKGWWGKGMMDDGKGGWGYKGCWGCKGWDDGSKGGWGKGGGDWDWDGGKGKGGKDGKDEKEDEDDEGGKDDKAGKDAKDAKDAKDGKDAKESASFTPSWGGIGMILNGFVEAQCLPGHELGSEDNCLSVSGLPADTDDFHLYKLLAPFGAIAPTGVKVMKNPDGSCTGVGFVNFIDPSSVKAASMMLDGTQLPDGTTMSVVAKKKEG